MAEVLRRDVAVGRREHVPSQREVDLGLAAPEGGEVSEIAVPGEPDGRRSLREAVTDVWEGLNPLRITEGYGAQPLVLLTATSLFTSWDDAAFGILLPEIRDDFGVDLAFFGVLAVVFTFIRLLLSPAAGWLADRVNRVRMLVIGAVSANFASVTLGLSPNVPWLVGTRVGAGVAGTLTEPASLPLLTDYYPQDRRARVFAFQGITGHAGRVVGPIVAGLVAAAAGWRPTMILLGAFATLVSLLLLRLREPPRGQMERLALGADEETARQEAPPVSWSEAWRAAASIVTLRRIWYATPFLTAAGQGIGLFLSLYWADEFGVGPAGRGGIVAATSLLSVVGLAASGPVADRLLADRPQRIMGLFGGVLILGCFVVVGLALSPVLWLSVLISLPLAVAGALILPALGALVSLVVPPRMRGLGLQTIAPWQVLGTLFIPFVFGLGEVYGLRGAMLVLVPVYLVGAVILTSSTSGVQRDIRAATAAAMADEAVRAAREAGGNRMLVCRDLDVEYDGTQVLFNVDLDVDEGELIALLGTNGAGKSTLLRAIAGVQEPSNGAIFLDGRDITHRPPNESAEGGIVFVPGGRAVFPSLSVVDNLRAAAWMRRSDEDWVAARTEDVLELFPELRDRLDQPAGTLSGGEQQMVAMGQALLMEPRLLMIDELSLGLAPGVVERLLDTVRRINDAGTTVILVEQSVNVAVTAARRAVFMDKGRVVFDGPTPDLLARRDLVRSIFLGGAGAAGPALGRRRARATTEEHERVLEIEGVSVSFGGVTAVDGVSLDVDAGEVVGIIGPNGAGKTTLFDAVSGYVRVQEGTVTVGATDTGGLSPDARARLGLGRSFQNARLFPSLTVRENVAVALERHLTSRSTVAAAAWLPPVRRSERRVARRVEWLVELLGLGDYGDKFVGELSTGSRRMVDLACIVASEPSVLLLDEPSSGLAQAEIEALPPVVRRLTSEVGCGVLVIEHDIPLVTGIADRLVAMELGQVVATGRPEEVVADPAVVRAYLGASPTVIARSGALADALASAGLAVDGATGTQGEDDA